MAARSAVRSVQQLVARSPLTNAPKPTSAILELRCRHFSTSFPIRATKRQRTTDTPATSPSKTHSESISSSSGPSSSSAKDAAPPSTPKSSTDDSPLPYLPRPLGVSQPPNTSSKTWQEKKEELLDRDRHIQKRKELVKEATQGYFHDYNAMRKDGGHGGKTWIAPNVLIREDRALYFPDISGTSLADRHRTSHTTDLCRGKISLVTVLNTRISEEHVNSFVSEALDDWEGKPGFNYIQINHQPNPLKSMLLQFFMSSLRRTMKESRWDGYMIAGGEWGGLKQPLGITNKHVGYTYLVDQNLKIRWAGCGFAERAENEGLRRALGVLMGRWKEQNEGMA